MVSFFVVFCVGGDGCGVRYGKGGGSGDSGNGVWLLAAVVAGEVVVVVVEALVEAFGR